MPGWSKGVCMFFFQEMQTHSSLSKNPNLAAVARKQRYAGLRGKVLRHKG